MQPTPMALRTWSSAFESDPGVTSGQVHLSLTPVLV